MATTPDFQLPRIDPNQASADATHNAALNRLDALIGGSVNVKDATHTAPPGSPVEGDKYLVASSATGAWAGHDNQIALYSGGWVYFTMRKGTLVYNEGASTLKCWNGSSFTTIF